MGVKMVVFLLLLAGCASGPESSGAPGIEAPEPSSRATSDPMDPTAFAKAHGAINSTWSRINLDGGGAFWLDVAEAKRHHENIVLDIHIHNASGAWGYQILQKREDVWVPAGFYFDGPVTARTWMEGAAVEETAPIVPGRRMMPLSLGEFAHSFGVLYLAATSPDGSARTYGVNDAYVLVLGSQGPIDLSIRLGNRTQLQFEREGRQMSMSWCGPNWMIDAKAVPWLDHRCPEAVVPPAAPVSPVAAWSGFRYIMFYERTTEDAAHDLAVGGEATDNSPIGHRPGVVTRSARYEVASAPGPGWGQSAAYVIDSNSAGRWAHEVELYDTNISWQGPLAGGPFPIFHQASDLVVGGPWWSCYGSGTGEGRTRLEVDSLGHPASGGLDQLLVAHVDHGIDLAVALGGSIHTGCDDVGPLYILEIV